MLRRVTAFLLVLILIVSCIGLSHAASVRTLKKGSRGDAVKTLQTALTSLWLVLQPPDGLRPTVLRHQHAGPRQVRRQSALPGHSKLRRQR